MSEALCRKDQSGDALHVWIDGWHFSFPSDGGKPDVERGAPAPDATSAGDTVLVERSGKGLNIRVGDWIVIFGVGSPQSQPSSPRIQRTTARRNRAAVRRRYRGL